MKQVKSLFLTAYIFLISSSLSAQAIEITPDKPSGIYNSGETVTWAVQCNPDSTLTDLRYKILKGGLVEIEEGTLNTIDHTAALHYTFEQPGSVILEVRWGEDDNWFRMATGGAMASPEKFRTSAEKPADFDSFWTAKVRELQSVPADPVLKVKDSGKPGIQYWMITMNNIRDTHIQGQLARPEKGKKLPAMLIVQWAGVYPLQKDWAVNRAAQGWLVLNIEAHDLPIDRPVEFYREQSKGKLKNYWAIGNDNRENSYFLRMYLSCYRAAQYLTERPDWDGKTLVVTGDSQGGQQTLMTAGFHPAITAAVALVPAGSDMMGPEMGRKGGWPQWYDWTEGKDPEKVRQASRYFDVVNFVTRIKCPVLVGVGLLDRTCPPEGIIAGLNQLSTPAEIIVLPKSGHQDWKGSQAPFRDERDNVWFPALQKGGKAPVNEKLNSNRMKVIIN